MNTLPHDLLSRIYDRLTPPDKDAFVWMWAPGERPRLWERYAAVLKERVRCLGADRTVLDTVLTAGAIDCLFCRACGAYLWARCALSGPMSRIYCGGCVRWALP